MACHSQPKKPKLHADETRLAKAPNGRPNAALAEYRFDLKEETSPYARIVVAAMLLQWVGPGLTWLITRSDGALVLAASITSALFALVFLLFCLPLAELTDRVQRAHFELPAKIMDLVLRHSFLLFGWPESRRGWILANLAMAVYFFVVAILAFFWATGDAQSEQALTRWIEHVFRSLFGR
jgi:hypothetical protein